MEIRALTSAEQKYTYAQSMQLEGQTANIGHLRGDFDSSGYGFYTTWTDTRTQWKTDEFKAEFDEVINALRSDKYGLLKSRSDMSAYARQYADSTFTEKTNGIPSWTVKLPMAINAIINSIMVLGVNELRLA